MITTVWSRQDDEVAIQVTTSGWLRRGAVLLAGAAATLPLLSTGAMASDSTTQASKVTAWNWYYNPGITVPVSGLLPVTIPEQPVPNGILIPTNDLAVSQKANTSATGPDRETYLMFSTGSAVDPDQVTSFTFTLTVDKSNLTNVPPGEIPLIACLPSRVWDAGDGGTGFSQKPVDDCSQPVAATYDKTADSYTFQIKDIAQVWVEGSPVGVAIRSALTYKTPFILAFQPASTVKASISYEVVTDSGSGGSTLPVVLPDVTPQQPPTVDAAPVVTIPVTPTAPMQDLTPPAPVTAAPPDDSTTTAALSIGRTTYGGSFWLWVGLGCVGLLVIGFSLGRRPDVTGSTVAAASTTRLAQVLSARARAK